jgi:purine-nucleoside phosphorylase
MNAVEAIAVRIRAAGPAPELAVVLGSGWDCAAELVETPEDIPYPELPHDASPRLQR